MEHLNSNIRTVYLAGPISGCTENQASEWRTYVRQRLFPGIVVIDPVRDAGDFSIVSDKQLAENERLHNLLHGKEILERDRQDVSRCDLVLANFLGAKSISIGSVGEIFWADVFRKPVLVVRESGQNPHDHGLINAIAFLIVNDLDTAIAKINRVLS